jgi:hypothetical protein
MFKTLSTSVLSSIKLKPAYTNPSVSGYSSEVYPSDSESDNESQPLTQPVVSEHIPRKGKRKELEKAELQRVLTYGDNLNYLDRALGSLHSDMFSILDKCEQQINPDKFPPGHYEALRVRFEWLFPQLQIPSIQDQISSRVTNGENLTDLITLRDEADSQAEYIDICHDCDTVLDWIVKLHKELGLNTRKVKSLIAAIKTRSDSFNPKKGHEELDEIIKNIIAELRRRGFQIIDFQPTIFIDVMEGLKTFVLKSRKEANLRDTQKLNIYNESGRTPTHSDIDSLLQHILGTPIQAIDAGPGRVSTWIPGDKWFCEDLYGGVTYGIECLPETKELLIVSWIKIKDGLYYHVFRSTGAISINEVIRILKDYFNINDFNNGIRGTRGVIDEEDEVGVGSGNVTLIFAGTANEINPTSTTADIFNAIKQKHKATIDGSVEFVVTPQIHEQFKRFSHRIIACTLGLKTIGDRSSTNIIERSNIHIFVSVDEFLAKILQILFVIGKLSKLPTIFLQKRGGFDVYEMPLDTTAELKERFMRLMYWNKDNREVLMYELIQKFGLDLLNTLCEITYRKLPPELSLWQRIEVEILKSINVEFKKRCNAFNEKMKSLRKKLETALAEHNNENIIKCLSQVPSQNELNPSAFIAELLGEENPFIDIDPSEQLNKRIQQLLLSKIPSHLHIQEDLLKLIFAPSFYKREKRNIELEFDTIFNKCLIIQKITEIKRRIGVAYRIDYPDNTMVDASADAETADFTDGLSYLQRKLENTIFGPNGFFTFLRGSKLLKDKFPFFRDNSKACTVVLKVLSDRWDFFNEIFDEVAKKVKAEIEFETGESEQKTNSKASRAGDDISEIGSIYEFVDLGIERAPMDIHIDDKYIHLKIKTRAGANDKDREALGKKIREAIEVSIYDENDITLSRDGHYLILPSSIELLLDIRTRFGDKETTIGTTRVNVKDICNQAISKRLADLRGYQLMTNREQKEIRGKLFPEEAVSFGTCFPFCGSKGGRKTRRIHKRITSKKNKRSARTTRRRRN